MHNYSVNYCPNTRQIIVFIAGGTANINYRAPVKGQPLGFDRAEKNYHVNFIGVPPSVETALAIILSHRPVNIAILSSAAAIQLCPQSMTFTLLCNLHSSISKDRGGTEIMIRQWPAASCTKQSVLVARLLSILDFICANLYAAS